MHQNIYLMKNNLLAEFISLLNLQDTILQNQIFNKL